MVEIWNSSSVPATTRLDFMRTAIADTIAPFDVRTAPDLVGGEFRAADIGTVKLVTWTSVFEQAEVVRSTRLIKRSDPEFCKIDVVFDGHSVFEQHGRQADLLRGDFSFADLSRPCRLAGQLRTGAAVLFPRALMPLRDRDTKNLAGIRFSAREPHARLVSLLVAEMAKDPSAYEGVGSARISGAVLDLIVAAAGTRLDRTDDVPLATRRSALLSSIYVFIEEHLRNPELCPAAIAAAHHISPRYLYKLFESEDRSVAEWIRTLRLERCRLDLLNPSMQGRPVATIARRWGFENPGAFSRVFRHAYGMPPSEYRRLSNAREPADHRGGRQTTPTGTHGPRPAYHQWLQHTGK